MSFSLSTRKWVVCRCWAESSRRRGGEKLFMLDKNWAPPDEWFIVDDLWFIIWAEREREIVKWQKRTKGRDNHHKSERDQPDECNNKMKYFLSLNLAWLLFFFLFFCTWREVYSAVIFWRLIVKLDIISVAKPCCRVFGAADKCSWEIYTLNQMFWTMFVMWRVRTKKNALIVWVYMKLLPEKYKSMKLYLDWIKMVYFAIHFLCCCLLLSVHSYS